MGFAPSSSPCYNGFCYCQRVSWEVVLNSKSKYAILLFSSILVVYAVIGGMLGRVNAQNGSYQQLSIFMEVLNRIQNDYVDEPSMRNAVNGAIRGLLEN